MAKHRDEEQEFLLEENETEMIETEITSESDEDSSENEDLQVETDIFLSEEEQSESFLPDVDEAELEALADGDQEVPEQDLSGTELDDFESAEIEEVEFVEDERLESILESILFASDRPVSLAQIKLVFKGTNISTQKIKRCLDQLAVEYAGGRRGITLEEVPGGYQLRTKVDNMEFLRRTLKTRQFKLSGPALEVLSIVAYKQPVVKSEVDEIRGVESGHLLRALMEKNLVCFQGKSELPGRPMQYGTTRKFLEIFGLRNLKELPTLSQIDELLPEGIDEESAEQKPTLASITDSLAESVNTVSYSSGEEELMKIQSQLEEISTSTDFFEQEKIRQAEKRDAEKAQNIREALAMGEPVATRDANWLVKYDEALAAGTTLVRMREEAKKQSLQNLNANQPQSEGNEVSAESGEASENENEQLQEAIEAFENDTDVDRASFDEDSEALSEEDELPFLGEADEVDGETENNI
ncbi:MAG: SMC-Scp complex subunit ScpB [Bdellovibrionia bacterium]